MQALRIKRRARLDKLLEDGPEKDFEEHGESTRTDSLPVSTLSLPQKKSIYQFIGPSEFKTYFLSEVN